MAFFLLLIVAFESLLASPSLISASSGGFKAVLKHVDYGTRLNEHFQLAVQRSKMEVDSRKPRPNAFTGGRIDSGNGEFFMNLTIGTPPTTYLALIDTDTDFMWAACKPMQCGAHGKECSKLQPFDPAKSSTYKKLSCTSTPCKLATNTSCSKKDNGCVYKYQYPAGSPSSIQGDLAIETFGSSSSFNGGKAELIFGCTHTTSIERFEDIGMGFVGLGRGNVSLVSQLNVTRFSHLFPSYDNPNTTGELAFGSYAKPRKEKGTVISDMLQNPINRPSSYYIDLKGIKVNGIPLAIEPSAFEINTTAGVGGVVIDSGMSVSYLEQGAYDKLKEKLDSLIKLPKVESEAEVGIGLDLCYKIPKHVTAGDVDKYLPNVSFTLGNGKRRADLLLSTGNAFRSYENGQHEEVSCLAMAAAPASDGRSSLGNMQLQKTLVVYDLAANKVYFTPNTV